MTPMVVFSHVRWSFVRQRPQHLMTRLAAHYDIHFIEAPVTAPGCARLLVRHVAPGVTVLVPQIGADDDPVAQVRALLAGAAREHALRGAVAWVSAPRALPLALALDPRLVVYDCIDAWGAAGDPALAACEEALLARADLVFAGGPALYESHRRRHPAVHCMPAAVDATHFAPRRLDPADPEAELAEQLQRGLPRPRLGCFGVIDERLDFGLIEALADARPHWPIVMVGPVVGLEPAALPQRPNLHWLGQQPYARLPYLLAGWDLCLMPYAVNRTTRWISPTKTLEYMAGEKPVVSTPVPDVVLLYGSVVRIADGAVDFVGACDELLAESPRARSRRAMEMLTTVSTQSWDRSAETVHALIAQALAAPLEMAA